MKNACTATMDGLVTAGDGDVSNAKTAHAAMPLDQVDNGFLAFVAMHAIPFFLKVGITTFQR